MGVSMTKTNLRLLFGEEHECPRAIWRHIMEGKIVKKASLFIWRETAFSLEPSSQTLFQNPYFRPKEPINGQKDLRTWMGASPRVPLWNFKQIGGLKFLAKIVKKAWCIHQGFLAILTEKWNRPKMRGEDWGGTSKQISVAQTPLSLFLWRGTSFLLVCGAWQLGNTPHATRGAPGEGAWRSIWLRSLRTLRNARRVVKIRADFWRLGSDLSMKESF